MRTELVPWGQTKEHMALVNRGCALRNPVEKRSNLNNRTKKTVRSYKVLDSNGGTVGGFTIRTNCWYLAEVKYIFAEGPKILDYILSYAMRLGARPVYQTTVAKTESVLAKALSNSGFVKQFTFDHENRQVAMWGRAVKQRTESLNLLPEEEAAALVELSGPRQLKAHRTQKRLKAPKASSGFKANDHTTWTGGKMYRDETRKTDKVHRHSGLGWHPVSKKHQVQ